MERLLQVKNLTTNFYSRDTKVSAVNGVSFSLDRGRTLGIVGESGCGKSVMSLSIMRLLPPHTAKIEAGQILLEGEDLARKKEREMRAIRGSRIAMIFQDPLAALSPTLTVGKQLRGAITAHRSMPKSAARRRGVELLGQVGIPEPEKRMDEYPHQLSGGMRQRVVIAQALAGEPALLIADEPTTALDVTVQAQILELLQEMKRLTRAAMMFITHDMGVVAQIADEVMVMYAGKVVEYAGADHLFDNPLHPYTQGLLHSIPKLDQDTRGELYSVRGTVPAPHRMPAGCAFCTRCDFAMPRCPLEAPPLVQKGDAQVRCWRYVEGWGDML